MNLSKTTIDISRKGSVVREKCRQLAEIVSRLSPDGTIQQPDLEALVEDYCGADKTTVRAYVGYLGRIARNKKTGEGYLIGQKRKGYIEKFGFMHRIRKNRQIYWRLNQTLLSPSPLQNSSESLSVQKGSMKKSLSICVNGRESQEQGVKVAVTNDRRKKEEEYREREKFFKGNGYRIVSKTLTAEEEAVLTAMPSREPDRAKMSWSSETNE